MKVRHCHGQLLNYTTRDWHELYFTPKVISDPSGFFPRLIWSTFTQRYHRSRINRGNNVLGLDSRLQPDWTFVKTYKVGQRHDVSCRGTAIAANNNNNLLLFSRWPFSFPPVALTTQKVLGENWAWLALSVRQLLRRAPRDIYSLRGQKLLCPSVIDDPATLVRPHLLAKHLHHVGQHQPIRSMWSAASLGLEGLSFVFWMCTLDQGVSFRIFR